MQLRYTKNVTATPVDVNDQHRPIDSVAQISKYKQRPFSVSQSSIMSGEMVTDHESVFSMTFRQ